MLQRITLLVLVALAASAHTGFAAEQKIKVAYAAISPIMSGVWMAKETRAFEKHGLDADLVYL